MGWYSDGDANEDDVDGVANPSTPLCYGNECNSGFCLAIILLQILFLVDCHSIVIAVVIELTISRGALNHFV